MNTAYLGLGSSLGKKEHTLLLAIENLKQYGVIIKTSSFFYNSAWGGVAQNTFVNMALEIQTPLSPEALLEACQKIENTHGRSREEKWNDRSLDIDILCYNKIEITSKNLNIPHPLIPKRDFVLKPLKEISSFIIVKEKLKILKNTYSEKTYTQIL
ncbi:2-amino-4-hydroxy-6-hydroxymethyldihydropteridine diphosphokinase [Candidatus Peregrinibacteria bacterium]|nr:2-amino-4-hydroxy-6-hydroxymethyldihydropteridine diphosphokinase [Candidatus Peregrinibacteria bacterium]